MKVLISLATSDIMNGGDDRMTKTHTSGSTKFEVSERQTSTQVSWKYDVKPPESKFKLGQLVAYKGQCGIVLRKQYSNVTYQWGYVMHLQYDATDGFAYENELQSFEDIT
jgi:hypothetical protein